MIEFVHGDLLQADVEVVVNTVNCVGVMGKGIALQFKNTYPENFRHYHKMCMRGELQPGGLCIYDLGAFSLPHYIVNFPTKRHWRDPSRLDDIRLGLTSLSQFVNMYHIQSMAIPPLGCGNGGLSWDVVRPLIEHTFENFATLRLFIYEPDTKAPEQR